MQSYFSKGQLTLSVLLLVALSTLTSCSPLQRETDPRQFLPPLTQVPSEQRAPEVGSTGLLDDPYSPSKNISACDWIDYLGSARNEEDRFRLLGDWKINEQNTALLDLSGNLDAAGSALYSYALLGQSIPDKEEFYALIDQEMQKIESFWGRLPLVLGKFLMRTGIMNAYNQRNSIIQDKVNEALPGIFSSDGEQFEFRQSIPWAIFRAGNPALEKTKTKDIKEWIKHYANVIPLFAGGTWQSVEEDFRMGLSVAIRGLLAGEPAERACSTVLFHHALGQLLSFTGYDRLPMGIRPGKETSYLLGLNDILDSPEGKTFVVCPTEGSFALDGRRKIMDRDALSTFDSDKISYELMKSPQVPRRCERKEAVTLGSSHYLEHQGDIAENFASATDWLSFASSLGHFIVAFNPGASWWQGNSESNSQSDVGFPMSPFDSLDRIRAAGAILPTDAHALSLAMLNISFGSFKKYHLVMLDENNHETTNSKAISKLRLSEAKHTVGTREEVETSLRSATLLAELAFKLGDSLEKLSTWKKNAEDSIKADLAQEKDPKRRAMIQRDFNDFVESMFGTKKVLHDLTFNGADSIRAVLKDAKLASAMLLAAFAQKDHETQRIECAGSLVLDLETGIEKKTGLCNPDDKSLWRYTLHLIAKEYRSPLFEELANNSI